MEVCLVVVEAAPAGGLASLDTTYKGSLSVFSWLIDFSSEKVKYNFLKIKVF